MSDYIEIEVSIDEDSVEVEVENEIVIREGGSNDYNDLINKPIINGITVKGNIAVTSTISSDEISNIFTKRRVKK